MKKLIILAGIVYGFIILRNKAKQVPILKPDEMLLVIPPIPIGTLQAGGEVFGKHNIFRIIFGTELVYNSKSGQWQIEIPPLVIKREQLDKIPKLLQPLLH